MKKGKLIAAIATRCVHGICICAITGTTDVKAAENTGLALECSITASA